MFSSNEISHRESGLNIWRSLITGPSCGRCPVGKFLERECDRVRGVDRRCRLCSEFCGEGVTDCIPNGDGGALCSHCNFNTQFPLFAEDRDGDGYGLCKKCTPCNPGEYVFRPCAGTRDNICRKCRCRSTTNRPHSFDEGYVFLSF